MTIEGRIRGMAEGGKFRDFSMRTLGVAPGKYGEGDTVLGVRAPLLRGLVRQSMGTLSKEELRGLLASPVHEVRLFALFYLGDDRDKARALELYLEALDNGRVDNWDLVDASAHKIAGRHAFENGDAKLLRRLADAPDLWKNRAAIVSQLYFVRRGSIGLILEHAEKFAAHPHELIHKACGWLLREAWKADPRRVEKFLRENALALPRITMSYACERMDARARKSLQALRKREGESGADGGT
ncbi:MAG: DNA alkylation repair protein [Rickettsiales bacterium]|nr:DNA alkylation repair protein [Rickettsiales bacterium]